MTPETAAAETRTEANGMITGWLTGATGDLAQWQREWLHCMAAIGEGLCPVCCLLLVPVTMPGCDLAGHCVPCRKYWFTACASQEAGFVIDFNPWDGSPRPPERAIVRS